MTLLEALKAKEKSQSDADVIFTYGIQNHAGLYKDYVYSKVYNGDLVGLNETDEFVIQAIDKFGSAGTGFKIQSEKDVVDNYGLFLKGIISKQVKLLRDDLEKIDTDDPANYDEYFIISKQIANLSVIQKKVLEDCLIAGNGLKSYLNVHKKNIRIVGNADGNVKVVVSKFKIDENNAGETVLLTENGNACNEEFEITGCIRGLSGFSGIVNDNHNLYFIHEEGDLYIEETWIKGGKVKSREHGKLIS